MERRESLRRSTRLRSDPEAAVAWQRRSRVNLARRPPRTEGPTAEKQRKQPRRRVEFKARRPARTQPCACGCGRRAAHWHHWLDQEYLRVYARGLRLPGPAHDKMLRALLRDERNLSAYAAGCHLDTREGQTGFTAEDVPDSAHAFAAELGPEWAERLRREYRPTNTTRGGQP